MDTISSESDRKELLGERMGERNKYQTYIYCGVLTKQISGLVRNCFKSKLFQIVPIVANGQKMSEFPAMTEQLGNIFLYLYTWPGNTLLAGCAISCS